MLDNILSILIFFPALAGVLGFMIHKDSMRAYGVAVATIEFALSLWLWFAFDSNVSGMQFIEQMPLVESFGINYHWCRWNLTFHYSFSSIFYDDWYRFIN